MAFPMTVVSKEEKKEEKHRERKHRERRAQDRIAARCGGTEKRRRVVITHGVVRSPPLPLRRKEENVIL